MAFRAGGVNVHVVGLALVWEIQGSWETHTPYPSLRKAASSHLLLCALLSLTTGGHQRLGFEALGWVADWRKAAGKAITPRILGSYWGSAGLGFRKEHPLQTFFGLQD